MNTSTVPSEAVHVALADAAVRRRIAGIVRRRVPPDQVNDVVQQVLCEALESRVAPRHPTDVARWLFGIARHKVADHHRAGRRRAAEAIDPVLIAARPSPLEARSLLREVIADATRDARGVQTMRWLAREAEGEQLDELAREASLPAATVRQRVSRMRRWLKKRWLNEALFIVAAGVVPLLVALAMPRHRTTRIAADSSDEAAANANEALQGRWRIQSIEADDALDSVRRHLVDAESKTTVIAIEGDRVHVFSFAHHGDWRLRTGPIGQGQFEVRLENDRGEVQRATGSFDGKGRLILSGQLDDWKGRVVLAR